jgi:hypothetical protein
LEEKGELWEEWASIRGKGKWEEERERERR